MISIITPFFNSAKYIHEAISSVVAQSYEEWELILINDGSTDKSKEIAMSFHDPRIKYFEQENKGVSIARNLGLTKMKGDYFCFLDADDVLTNRSLKSRVKVFEENPNVTFVDGQVVRMDSNLKEEYNIWTPSFIGNPLSDLVRLNGKSFFGPTWMIKTSFAKEKLLDVNLTHGEELLYYITLAKDGGLYSFTEEPILYYRDTPSSAMKNLKGLENGYRFIESKIRKWKEIRFLDFVLFGLKFRKSMSLAYLKSDRNFDAIKIWF